MKIMRAFIVLSLTIGLLLTTVSPGSAEFSNPSNFYGLVKVAGDNVASATTVWTNPNKDIYRTELLDNSGAVLGLDVVSGYLETPVPAQNLMGLLSEGEVPTDTPTPTDTPPPTNTPVPPLEYSLTVISANGTVAKSPNQATYHAGDVVQLTATPNAGWSFAYWSGGLNGGSNPASLTIQGSTVVAANYIQNDYTLTVNYASGTVIKNPNLATYHYGDVVQLTAVPAVGWVFAYWTGDLTGSTNPASLTILGNASVSAKFRAISTPSPISIQVTPNLSRPSPTPTSRALIPPSPTSTLPAIPPTPTLAPFVWPSSTPVIPKFLPDAPSNNFNLQLGLVIFLSATAITIVIWAIRSRTWRSG